MAHYSGINLVVGVNSANFPITAATFDHVRTVDVTETAPAPETIAVTHRADTARQIIEGLPGAPETNVVIKALLDDTWSALETMAINTQCSMWVWPRGRTDLYPMITIGLTRMHERTQGTAYDGAPEITTTWNSKITVVHTTYRSS